MNDLDLNESLSAIEQAALEMSEQKINFGEFCELNDDLANLGSSNDTIAYLSDSGNIMIADDLGEATYMEWLRHLDTGYCPATQGEVKLFHENLKNLKKENEELKQEIDRLKGNKL